jgi:hypothetical protein
MQGWDRLCALRSRIAVPLALTGERFRRLVLGVDDARATADRIERALSPRWQVGLRTVGVRARPCTGTVLRAVRAGVPARRGAMTDSPRVVVRGEAVAEAPPDAADLVVTVEVRDRRRDNALTLLAVRQQELTALLDQHRDALGTVSTEAVSVFPESDGTRVTGSVATTTTRVQLEDVAAAGELAVAVAGLPDTSLFGPHWRLSRTHPVHRQVRTDAVADAITRARAYAEALGCRLTGLVEVRDVGTNGGGIRAAAFSLATTTPTLELQPAAQEVRGQVEVTFTMSEPDQEVFTR